MSSDLPVLTSPPWSPRTKRTVTLIALGLVFYLSVRLGTAWTPVLIAVLLSYLLIPLVNELETMLWFIPLQQIRRTLAVFLTFTLVIASIVLVGIVIVPRLTQQVEEFVTEAPSLIQKTGEDLDAQLSKPIRLGKNKFVPTDLLQGLFNADGKNIDANDGLSTTLRGTVTGLIDPAAGLIGSVFTVLYSLLFIFVMMFYLMKDGTSFVQSVTEFVPRDYQDDMRFLLRELGAIWNAYYRGQFILSLSVGLATFVAMTLLGMPQPLVLAFIAGLLEFIPNIGPTLSAIPAVLMALVAESQTFPGLGGPPYAFVVMASYFLIQQLEAVLLVPRVMGSTLNLHPFVVLVAVVFGAKIAGVLGVILAAPVTATLRMFGTYLWSKLLDEDMFHRPSRRRVTTVISRNPVLIPAMPAALASSNGGEDISEGEIVEEE
ncbi:MAG: AI-2E family transporter [Chloroflexi bacterium]|nr:AI-2E family transporter [Chloroflexota bacterium]